MSLQAVLSAIMLTRSYSGIKGNIMNILSKHGEVFGYKMNQFILQFQDAAVSSTESPVLCMVQVNIIVTKFLPALVLQANSTYPVSILRVAEPITRAATINLLR